MELPLNQNPPKIMHIDLNSCFASVEQQANPLLRGRPVVVAAYNSPGGCVVSPSIEAKRLGIKVGHSVREARLIFRDTVVLTPDPPKYRDVHLKFRKIFNEYSPKVVPKSIDEAVIDFEGTKIRRSLPEIGREIKQRIRSEIGEWLSCNIGISTNRFLAKLAASLHKPDGLDVITAKNLRETLEKVKLTDLCGINSRFEARLNCRGVYTPLQFLDTPLFKLWKEIFRSIAGYYWYLRLRGWEIDEVDFTRRSFGQSYALGQKTADPAELSKLLIKLTEKMGRRLRHAGFLARGVHLAIVYADFTHWHKGKTFETDLFDTIDLFRKTQLIFNLQPERKTVAKLAVSCFNLRPQKNLQLNLFNDLTAKRHALSLAMDRINDRYGEFIITPALMLGMDKFIIDRIAFGGVKDLGELYENSSDT